MTGVLYIGFKSPEQKVAIQYETVCGDEIIERYNKIYESSINGGYKSARENMLKLSDEISKVEGVENDPNCQYILFWNANWHGRNDDSKTAVDRLVNLNKTGNYVSGSINNLYSLYSIKIKLANMSEEGL